MMKPTTIHDLATEMQTWLTFSPETLEKAKNSKVTTRNTTAFNKLVINWENGLFDEDPDMVGRWIEAILEKEG